MIGYDPRQPVAYNVAQHSVIRNASKPVCITPLVLNQLPITRRGLTEFTFSRFLVPWLCDFKGKAMFMDPDMIVLGDVCAMMDARDPMAGVVHVVKDQPEFEWPSMMVFSNARCRNLTPEYVENPENPLFGFDWADKVGEIPAEWNFCVGYQGEECNTFGPVNPKKLYHFTEGLPIWPQTRNHPDHSPIWEKEFNDANSSVSYAELMGNSVHAQRRKT